MKRRDRLAEGCSGFCLPVAVFLAVLLGTTGCGTEVGNGHHTTRKTETSAKNGKGVETKSSSPPSAPVPVDAGAPEATIPAASAEDGMIVDAIPESLQVVLNTCASPFAKAMATPVTLQRKDAPAGDVSAEFTMTRTEDVWEAKTAAGVMAYVRVPDAVGFDVELLDPARQARTTGDQCTGIVEKANQTVTGLPGKVTSYETKVTRGGVETTLRWYVAPSTAAGTSGVLRRIETVSAAPALQATTWNAADGM